MFASLRRLYCVAVLPSTFIAPHNESHSKKQTTDNNDGCQGKNHAYAKVTLIKCEISVSREKK